MLHDQSIFDAEQVVVRGVGPSKLAHRSHQDKITFGDNQLGLVIDKWRSGLVQGGKGREQAIESVSNGRIVLSVGFRGNKLGNRTSITSHQNRLHKTHGGFVIGGRLTQVLDHGWSVDHAVARGVGSGLFLEVIPMLLNFPILNTKHIKADQSFTSKDGRVCVGAVIGHQVPRHKSTMDFNGQTAFLEDGHNANHRRSPGRNAWVVLYIVIRQQLFCGNRIEFNKECLDELVSNRFSGQALSIHVVVVGAIVRHA
mmetsp:Transcript_22291/g.51347  ORF Transcript_22291/g.51347 Transcript_22291/m.51347 type:complete len:255 (-) Transcript_22291:620-1384(-)